MQPCFANEFQLAVDGGAGPVQSGSDLIDAVPFKEQFGDVVYVAINSSAARQSSLDGTAEYMKAHKMDLPALLDSDGAVGKMYGAKTTPHCYVISPEGTLVYAGAIDDGANGGAKMNYVVNAAKQLKAGETVSPSETKSYGCGVKYKKG